MNRTRIWMIGGAIAIVAVLLGGWTLGVQPFLTTATGNNAERKSVVALNETQQVRLAELAQQNEELPKLQAEVASATAALPSTPELSTFIGQLSEIADAAHVSLTSLASTDAQSLAATTDPAADPAATETDEVEEEDAAAVESTVESTAVAIGDSGLVAVPLVVTVDGSLEDLYDFVGRLQEGERLITVSDLTITKATGAAGQAVITGAVYVLPAS